MAWIGIVVSVVLSIISYIVAPTQKDQGAGPSSFEDLDVPTATEDRVIPILFGRRGLQSPNVVWYGDLYSEPMKRGG